MLSLPLDYMIKLLVSFLLGGLIGFERELHEKPAGLRTHIIVSLASTLFTILSLSNVFGNPTMISHDPARIAAGVLTGIGFLGAGVIVSTGGNIRGITTAASLWVTTAVGMAVGAGEYGLAVAAALLIFLILWLLMPIEGLIDRLQR